NTPHAGSTRAAGGPTRANLMARRTTAKPHAQHQCNPMEEAHGNSFDPAGWRGIDRTIEMDAAACSDGRSRESDRCPDARRLRDPHAASCTRLRSQEGKHSLGQSTEVAWRVPGLEESWLFGASLRYTAAPPRRGSARSAQSELREKRNAVF